MRLSLIAALLLSLRGLAGAEEARPAPTRASVRTWFEHLKEGLRDSSVARQRQKVRLTAVASVRGAEQGAVDPEKPVWKSSSAVRKNRALNAQKAELSEAITLILDGNAAEGDEKLAAFEKAHPESPLLADAREARSKIKAAEAGVESARPPATR